ncbi:MAG: hypothetical protein CR959_00285 [Fusobacteriales bacterium]|nr:MAG: hypothetical protein CR959_00285 [Fusobacteriales bacterium]
MIDLEITIKKILEEQGRRNSIFKKDWERYKTKKVTIFDRKLPRAQKVNNKINHDYVGVLINTKVGHYLGNPIRITLDEENNKSNELLKFRRYTAFDRVITELGIQAAVFGYGCCLAYIDELGKFDFIEIEPYNCYFSDELAFRIIQAKNDKNEDIEIIEAYDKQKRYFFEKKESSVNSISEYKGVKGGVNHLFNDIPLFKFKNNKEELSDTYRVRNIIEVVDKMYSDLASELEQFRLAYIKFKGCEPTDEQIASMVQTGAISLGEANADADFITKNLNIAGVLEAINQEVENIFKFAQSYDAYGDRTGYGQLTNLGIHFLMAPINNNCKKTIHYFKEALYQLFDFYSQTSDGSWLDPLTVDFGFTLDTPRNILEETQIQRNLEGLISTETRLKLATFVDNPAIEIGRLEAENKADDIYEEKE